MILLWISGLLAIFTALSAIGILLTKNILYAALGLLLALLGIAGLFALAGADFLAVSQIVVYIGGILVLLLFGIMLTTRANGQIIPQTNNHNWLWGGVLGAGLFGILTKFIFETQHNWQPKGQNITDSTISTLGINLMTDYLLPFEVIAILLLVALVGASLIAGRR
ncbi:MAG: NADH-quinone oxidoreductase subunit J [Thermonemataceae bacterium]|nr:NADH-quinone oxidoreductase subunit J [Thermonemataceae bacterium]